MKKLILATVFAVTMTVSAQTTPKQRVDTTIPDTTRNNDIRNDNMNNNTNNRDQSKTTDTTGNWKNKNAVKGEKNLKRKVNR
ncbi:hypothetical protein SAMN05880574_10674 [Chryseobacterium sp. RU37D]|uniref:hypothetical protein n=1 Tax=Chryseobacterium sp. RU37D TaxID=1907397 RepID=UPI0009572730|nr:hypothetical protein [Chryseobacterium sp. RU37D]SIQ13517.1 hypothetical protein SAMN05880574_10674 [Chryseobacterium sp. RU37D]